MDILSKKKKKSCVSIPIVAKHLDLPGTWMSPPEQCDDILSRCPNVCETREHFMDCMNTTRASIKFGANSKLVKFQFLNELTH